MGASSSIDLVDKNGKVICSETLQQGSCLAVLKLLIEEVAPKLMRQSRSHIVAASIVLQSNNAPVKGWVSRHLRNDLHANLGVRAFRVCEHSNTSLEEIASDTWQLA